MKKFFITFIIICPIIFGQNNFFSKKEIPVFRPNIHTQFLIFKVNDQFQVTYLYKIPYSRIVFEKVDDHFESGFELTLEIKNKTNTFIKREFVKDKLVSKSFEETISNTIYLENFLTITLPKDEYIFQVIFEDKLVNRQRPQIPVNLSLNDSIKNYSSLLIEKKNQNGRYLVANFSGMLPYSKENYDMIFFSRKFEEGKKVKITISQNDSVYLEQFSKPINFGRPVFSKINDKVSITFDSTYTLNGVIINDINKKLDEGEYLLRIISDDDKELDTDKIKVTWFNKPFSLNDSDFALEMIASIEPEDAFDQLLKRKLPSSELLKLYWKSKDPTPGTAFNELMEVFYDRVDYAETNFRNLSGTSGAKTDRGKIYIQNGAPDQIERGVNSDGKITETWYYQSPKRIFVFVDIRGDGSFRLESK